MCRFHLKRCSVRRFFRQFSSWCKRESLKMLINHTCIHTYIQITCYLMLDLVSKYIRRTCHTRRYSGATCRHENTTAGAGGVGSALPWSAHPPTCTRRTGGRRNCYTAYLMARSCTSWKARWRAASSSRLIGSLWIARASRRRSDGLFCGEIKVFFYYYRNRTKKEKNFFFKFLSND